jgi:hypothetical protein
MTSNGQVQVTGMAQPLAKFQDSNRDFVLSRFSVRLLAQLANRLLGQTSCEVYHLEGVKMAAPPTADLEGPPLQREHQHP